LFWTEAPDPYRELAILNSSVFNFLFNLISTDARGGYKRFKTVFMSKIPYANETKDAELSNLVKASMAHSEEETKFEERVLRFILSKFNLKLITPKLNEWYITPFEEILKELKKQKVSLSQVDEFNLYEFIEAKKEELLDFNRKSASLHEQLNDKVVELY